MYICFSIDITVGGTGSEPVPAVTWVSEPSCDATGLCQYYEGPKCLTEGCTPESLEFNPCPRHSAGLASMFFSLFSGLLA